MKIKYFPETDTLYLAFNDGEITETRELDEDTLLDFDGQGNICAITIEHAKKRADILNFSYEQVPGPG